MSPARCTSAEADAPARVATSTRRMELDEFGAPTIRKISVPGAAAFTASAGWSWRSRSNRRTAPGARETSPGAPITPAWSSDSVVCVTKPSASGSAGAKAATSALALDQRDRSGLQLAHRAHDLGMAPVADEKDVPAALDVEHGCLWTFETSGQVASR